GKSLAQPILQACSLVAYTCRLGPSDPALAAAPQRCACGKDQCEGDKCSESRHGFCPVMIEPKRHLAKEIDDPNSEPPELHRSPSHPSAACDGLLLRQRDELRVVSWHEREALLAPILFGLLDALLGGRDKIPPDVARAVHRLTAEQHQPRLRSRQ